MFAYVHASELLINMIYYVLYTDVPSHRKCKYSLKYCNFIGCCACCRVNVDKQCVWPQSNFTHFIERLLALSTFHSMQMCSVSLQSDFFFFLVDILWQLVKPLLVHILPATAMKCGALMLRGENIHIHSY